MTQKLRIRHPGGSVTIENRRTAGEVGNAIAEITQIPVGEQEWKSGYPPKRIEGIPCDEALPFEIDFIQVSRGHSSLLPESKNQDSDTVTSSEKLHFVPPGNPSLEPPIIADSSDGVMICRVVPSDNSCLFHAIAAAFPDEARTPASSSSYSEVLRESVARAVLDDTETYTQALLETQPQEYADWIRRDESWGGQIELTILSRLLQVEIVALDILRSKYDIYDGSLPSLSDEVLPTTNISFKRRIYVIYDGIHYDAVAFALDPQLPPDMDIRQFSPKDGKILAMADTLCEQQHQQKAFTNTSQFTLRCLVCQQGLEGQGEAVHHAQTTGHTNFAEY